MNELFSRGPEEAIRFLQRLRGRFRGKDLWIVDYYGRLGIGRTTRKVGGGHGLLHDVVQILSGQGVPPATSKEWGKIYRSAGCRLIEAHDFGSADIEWFIHRVRLE
jgi:hypothetical protein